MNDGVSKQRTPLARIIARTIGIMALDLGCVVAGFIVAIPLADYVADRTNVGIDMLSPNWNADPAILLGQIGFLLVSGFGVFIVHRLLSATMDHLGCWAIPLIIAVCIFLALVLSWRLHFDAGMWQT